MKTIEIYKRAPLVLLKLLLLAITSFIGFILVMLSLPILWYKPSVDMLEKIADVICWAYDM